MIFPPSQVFEGAHGSEQWPNGAHRQDVSAEALKEDQAPAHDQVIQSFRECVTAFRWLYESLYPGADLGGRPWSLVIY